MADLIRLGNVDAAIHKDKLGSPTVCLDDGNLAAFGISALMATGGIDMGDLAQELDQDEFDGPNMLNGECRNVYILF